MSNSANRTVKDSMGEMQVPESALWGATTQRALQNFPISDLRLPRGLIQALGLIKAAAASANQELGLLSAEKAKAIVNAVADVTKGLHDDAFPIDIFQTGSGTSSNMNANEVIAELAKRAHNTDIHPNDDVNMSQSSNDVIPSAIHVSTALSLHQQLIPALKHLEEVITKRGKELANVTKTGRTHLMDAMPVTFGQELSGFAWQIRENRVRIEALVTQIQSLAIGGTAVGTGINAHPEFARKLTDHLSKETKLKFTTSDNYFGSMSSQDAIVALSGQLKTCANSLMKIANDLRWMNSGPLAGLGEIALPALQPGSSIMPGKVNPVIPEAVMMVCAQVIGNDVTITTAGMMGNFQLNVMLPVIGYNILQSIEILSNASMVLADKAIAGFTVNQDKINKQLHLNPILVTALNPIIGYELGAKIAKTAYSQQRPIMEVAKEMTQLSEAELHRLLDPALLTKGGL